MTTPLTLVPLRIPSGWAIIDNRFFETTPIIENGVFVNALEFDEDLLVIEIVRFDGQSWCTNNNQYIVDLGWYPSEDINGAYKLTLLRGSWDAVLKTFKSRNIEEIRETIERWLIILSEYHYDEQAHQRL